MATFPSHGRETDMTALKRAVQRLELTRRNIVLSDNEVGSLSALGSITTATEFVAVNGDDLNTTTWASILTALYEEGFARWRTIAAAYYTATPASTSRINMSDTTLMRVGLPLRYAIGGSNYYGIVTSVGAGSHVLVAGAPLSGDLTALAVGDAEQVETERFKVNATYGDGVADLLLADSDRMARWERGRGFLVSFAAAHITDDTGADQPEVNIKVGGNAVFGSSVVVGTTWTVSGAVDVSTSNYVVDRGDALEVSCTKAGSNGDAEDLNVSLTFVLM